jgi:hypothetical protein
MKNIIIIILLLIITGQFYGQNTFNRLEYYYGPNPNSADFFENIIQYDGYFYGTVAIYDSLNRPHTGILKLNNFGDIVKKNIITNPNGRIATYQNQGLISTSDSNFIICSNLADSTWAGYLIKFNKELDTLWTMVYDMPVNLCGCSSNTRSINNFTAIKETPDKGFIIAGNYYKNCVNYQQYLRGYLLKVDSVGNIQWWKAYDDIYDLFDIELSVNGGYLVYNKWGGKSLVEFDSLGNEIWRKQPNYVPSMSNFGDISYCGNGVYAAASVYLWDIPNNRSEVHVLKFNAYTHQILWDTIYKLFYTVNSLSLNQVMGLEVDPQGNLVIWATAHVVDYPNGGGRRGAILKLNSQGDSLWARYYDSPGITWDDDLQLNDLIICDDGGYMGVGYELFDDHTVMAWLFKTDANGVLGFESSRVESSRFKVFPNPAHDYTTIELSENWTNSAELIIYNAVGQKVSQRNFSKGETNLKVNLQGLKPGIYFFELVGEDAILGSGKFVRD